MKQEIILSCLLFSATATFGQEKKGPIDIRREKCLNTDSNWTTYGMMTCEWNAGEEWDKELNKYYKLLMGVLNADEKAKLKTTQIEWLKYRDQESEFFATFYNDLQGTMWQPVKAGRYTDIIKQRALELKHYYTTWRTYYGE